MLLGAATIAPISPVHAAATIDGGITGAKSLEAVNLNPKQIGTALDLSLVKTTDISGLLGKVLTAQGFTAANGWELVAPPLSLANDAKFKINTYTMTLNPAKTAFGEIIDFTLSPGLTAPAGTPAGATVTQHWLQLLNQSEKVNNYGFSIAGETGFYKFDNGNQPGGAASGAGTGPYYDSNAGGGSFSTPPNFYDYPRFYSGNGFYFYATTFPVWDVYVPAAGATPAKESIYIGDYGLKWGFSIAAVPEPGTWAMLIVGFAMVGAGMRRRQPATRISFA